MLIKLVNAFSNNVNAGNTAAICIVKDFPNIEKMQDIATKINFSETAFVKKISQNNYYIRWFTPTSEAPICVHATLAAAHMLYENCLVKNNEKIKFTNIQREFVAFMEDGWISLNFPKFTVKRLVGSSEILSILQGYKVNYLGLSENVVFAEFEHNYEVRDFIPKLHQITLLPYRALLITSRDDKYDFISRYFAPSVGIDEDPVCGSAHCRLIPYWAKKLNKASMIAYQASKQGGVIRCKDLKSRVIISGQSVTLDDNNTIIL
jgi:predicted PhzF superfamily epimerase YddE/YHI9